jgi:hypothetical protein
MVSVLRSLGRRFADKEIFTRARVSVASSSIKGALRVNAVSRSLTKRLKTAAMLVARTMLRCEA